jgi:hypothetical protein
MNFTKSTMPVPALTRTVGGNKGQTKYPFADLAIGESLTTSDFVDAKKAASKLTSAVASYRKRSGDTRKFSVRTFKQDGVDFVGVFVLAADAPAADAA